MKLSPDELADLAERIKHMTAENLISALKEQGEISLEKEDQIQLMSAVASVAIANTLIYLQNKDEQRARGTHSDLVQ